MAQRKLTKVSGTCQLYDKGSNIGRGGFSIVFRGFLESDVYKALAVKRIQICDHVKPVKTTAIFFAIFAPKWIQIFGIAV